MNMTTQSVLGAVFDGAGAHADDRSGAVLSVRDLTVTFGGIVALSDVTFHLDKHDMAAIVGPNGAGKSTMLNAINGLVRSSGHIELHGRPVHGTPAASIAKYGVGRSFQDPQLVDEYTVLENVMCGAHIRLSYGLLDQLFRPRRVERAERQLGSRARGLLEFFGLDGVAHEEAGSLSYGARKLVDIGRAMLPGPHLLLLDEPSSGLDAHERKSLESTLIALRDERLVTALVVEHHMDLVRSVATRVVGMQAGEVIAIGTPSEVLDSETFREAVVGGSRSAPSANGTAGN